MSSTISNMSEAVKRRYDNSRRQAQARATRLKVIEAAKHLFTEHGYPATTIEAIAEAADTPLPTVYRLFGSKRALLAAVLDIAFGGDDQPIAFADRPAVRAAQAETDPVKMVNAFARIVREFMERSSAIQHVLATAAQVDPDAAGLLAEIRRQRHTGQSRIAAALAATRSDQPIAFADRPAVRAAQAETDPVKMVNAFARIVREFMERSSAIQHVLATAAQVDPDAAGLLAEIRRQRHTGQSRIAAALAAT